jgi:DNA polymerase bacteriophage-type
VNDDLVLDFETRSGCSLKKAGAYRYAADPTTEVLVASYCIGQGPIKRWRPYKGELPPFDVVQHVMYGKRVVTHGPFERVIWYYKIYKQFKMPMLYIEQTSDLMVRAFACNLPGKLEQLAKVLGLPEKDMDGHAIMMRMTKPRRVNLDGTIVWWEEPDKLTALEDYCDQDVNVERHANAMLPELTSDELELWHIDQRINDRGIPHDMQFVERAIKLVDYAKLRANEEIANLTNGAVNKATEVAKIVAWLNSQHVMATSLRKGDRQKLLDIAESIGNEDAADVIELRSTTGKTSTAKYRAIKGSVGADGRGRGWLQFGGAQQTMRWAGRVVQPQNYVRVSDDEEAAIVSFVVGITSDTTRPLGEVYDMIELIGPPRLANGDRQGGLATLAWLAKSLRSTIAAPAGTLFVGGDFSNIEGRINAWLAQELWKLQAFRDYDNHVGPDLYKLAYAKAFNISPDTVSKPLRQIGKVIELQCGYQGGVGAFITATNTYLLKLPALVRAISATTPAEVWDDVARKFPHARDKMQLDEATWTAVKVAVLGWRKSNSNIVQSWWDLQDAAIQAVDRPGVEIPVYAGRVSYFSDTQFLYCRLPSGRVLMYAQPHAVVLTEEKIYDGMQYVDVDCLFPHELDALIARGYKIVQHKRRGVQFYGLNDVKQWTRKTLYGGYQCENIVQGTARDFLAPAIVRAEQAGYEICLTVHDELLSLIKPNWYDRSVDHERYYLWLMTQLPTWAQDFPMAASVWSGDRYVK